MIGQCPHCGKEHKRKPPVDAAVCDCGNPDYPLVPLTLALTLPASMYKRYAMIARLAGVSVERLVNEVLKEAAKCKLKEYELLPRQGG